MAHMLQTELKLIISSQIVGLGRRHVTRPYCYRDRPPLNRVVCAFYGNHLKVTNHVFY